MICIIMRNTLILLSVLWSFDCNIVVNDNDYNNDMIVMIS